jgi:hypothetical protein
MAVEEQGTTAIFKGAASYVGTLRETGFKIAARTCWWRASSHKKLVSFTIKGIQVFSA